MSTFEQELWGIVTITLGMGAFSLCLLAEFLYSSSLISASMALVGVLLSEGLLALAVFRFGHIVHPGRFRMWQPFVGGINFVLMQLFGWLFFGVSMMMTVVMLSQFEYPHKAGTLSALGCLILASSLLLRTSVSVFDPEGQIGWFSTRIITRSNAVAVLGLLFALCQSLVTDLWTRVSPYKQPLHSLTLLECFIAEFVVIWHRPQSEGNGTGWWDGGFNFIVLRSCGVVGLVVSSYLHVCILTSPAEEVRLGLRSAVTFFSAFSVVLHILAYDSFDSGSTRALLRRVKISRTKAVLLAISVFLCLMSGSIDLIGLNRLTNLSTQVSSSIIQTPLFAAQFLLAPFAHFLTCKRRSRFRWWQPFLGGSRFVILQAVGWALYSLSMLGAILLLINGVQGIWLASLCACLSTGILVLSILFFEDPRDAESNPLGAGGRRTNSSLNSLRITSTGRRTAPITGELLTSLFFIMGGVLMFVVADQRLFPDIPAEQLMLFGGVLVVASTPLAHLSGCKMYPRAYRVFQPFRGGPDYIALQAVAWSLFGVLLPLLVILWLNLRLAPDGMQNGTILMTGGFGVLPYVGIIVSLFCFKEEDSASHPSSRRQVMDLLAPEVEEALRLLCQAKTPQMQAILTDFLREHDAERLIQKHQEKERYEREGGSLSYFVVALALSAFFGLAGTELVCYLIAPSSRFTVGAPIMVLSVAGAFTAGLTTHLAIGPKRWQAQYKLWQPFRGGYNFIVLQTFGWTFLSLQIVVATVILFSHMSQLAVGYYALLGFFGFTGDLLLVMSIAHFDPVEDDDSDNADTFFRRNAEWGVGALLTFCGVLLFVTTKIAMEWRGDVLASAPAIYLSLLACMAGIPLTLISVWKQRKAATNGSAFLSTATSTEVPHFTFLLEVALSAVMAMGLLREGFSFVTYQWLVYLSLGALTIHAGALVTLLKMDQWSLSSILRESRAELITSLFYSVNVLCSVGWIIICFGLLPLCVGSVACFLCVTLLSTAHRLSVPLSKAIMTVSFLHEFSIIGETRGVLFASMAAARNQMSHGASADPSISLLNQTDASGTLSGSNASHLYVAESESVLWQHYGVVALNIFLLAYCYTYRHGDQVNGLRRWNKLRGANWVWDSIAHYFRFQIKSHYSSLPTAASASAGGQTTTGERRKEIFCFHPHGVCPYTCFWAPLSLPWRQAGLPISVVVHVANALLSVPILRDILLWIGVADVSPESINRALTQNGAIMIVPGGRAEMNEAALSRSTKTIRIVRRHKGIFRLALTHGASLVPVLNFGELDLLTTVGAPASMQDTLTSMFGVVYPQLPVGRMFLPIPHRVPLRMLVGAPVEVDQRKDPRPSEIEELRVRYYTALSALFEEGRREWSSYAHLELEFVD